MEQQSISRQRLYRLAALWPKASVTGHTYAVCPGGVAPQGVSLPREIVDAIEMSGTGGILFWSQAQAYLVIPPFPVEAEARYQGWHLTPLEAVLDRRRRIGVLLLRLGSYAVGIFEGDKLVASKVGSRFVKGRHRKGGSSSARFARRREEQSRALFGKVCRVFRDRVENYSGDLDHLIFGGDRNTLLAFEKQCPYMDYFRRIRSGRILNVVRPSMATLSNLHRSIYASGLVTFNPD